MALTILALGNPANQIGGPGTCRAKWVITDDGEGGPAFITNAMLLAAFNNASVPAELRAILTATYATDLLADTATALGMRFSIYLRETSAPNATHGASAGFVIEGGPPGPPRIQVDTSAAIQVWQLELVFHHSETR